MAAQLQISVRHLGQIEAGLRTPDDELLEELSKLYGIDVDQLQQRAWAARVPTQADTGSDNSLLGWLPADPRCGNDVLLRSIGASLRTMRSIGDESPVYLRSPDVPVLASRIDLDDPKLSFYVMQHLRLTWTESCELIEDLRQVTEDSEPPSSADRPVRPPAVSQPR